MGVPILPTDALGRRLRNLLPSLVSIVPGAPARRIADGSVVTASPLEAVVEAPSGVTVYALGDSTTQGNQDGTGITWPAELAKMLDGVTVVNGGLSGRTSTEMAMRFGALVPQITVTGNTIPASGPVAVTAISPAGTWRTGVVETYPFTGVLAGIPGTLSHDETADTWTFTRTSSGAATTIAAASPFYMTHGDAYRDDAVVVSALGINNYAAASFDDTLRDTDIVRRHLTPRTRHHLVLPILTGTGQGIGNSTYTKAMSTNDKLKQRFSGDFLDHRRALIDYGLELTNTTATANDTTDRQTDTVPRSLLYDTLHPKGTTYRQYARLVGNELADRGWVKQIDPMNIPGALVIAEPGAPWNPWASGVPADATQVPNLAAGRHPALGLDSAMWMTWTMNSSANDGVSGIMERSSKGGLHHIASQATPPASNTGAGLQIPSAVLAFMEANPKHEFYMAVWGRVTRVFSGSFSFVYSQLAYNSSGYKGFGYLGTGTPMPTSGSGLRTTLYQENQNTAAAMFQDVSGYQDTPNASLTTAPNRVAAAFGRYAQANGTLTNLPSWVFYKFVLIDLTVAKKSRNEIHALNYADFVRQVNTSGGRYYNDTYTNPSTLA